MSLAHICIAIPTGGGAPPDEWDYETAEDGEGEEEEPVTEAIRADLHLSRARCGGPDCGERLLARNVTTDAGVAFVALCWRCDRQSIDGAAIAAARAGTAANN